jgi:acetyltransferase-like isoleucine patch superfamily enzyme
MKQAIDYLYLRTKGVDTKYGYCRLVGFPIIEKAVGSKIIIEKGVSIVSKTKGNIAGINNRSILATLDKRAEIILKSGSGVSGAKLVSLIGIEIGEHSGLGVNCTIYDTDFHPVDAIARRNQKSPFDAGYKRVIVGNDVLIGANCIILKGSKIGDRSVVGAGSVVCGQTIEADTVYAGNPIRKVRDLGTSKLLKY